MDALLIALTIAAVAWALDQARGGSSSPQPAPATAAIPQSAGNGNAAVGGPVAQVPPAFPTAITSQVDGPDESTDVDSTPVSTTAITSVSDLAAPNAPAAFGPPAIPTMSNAYNASNGYTGWTPALALQNIQALGALSAKVNAGQLTRAQFQAIVNYPGGDTPGATPIAYLNGSPYYVSEYQ